MKTRIKYILPSVLVMIFFTVNSCKENNSAGNNSMTVSMTDFIAAYDAGKVHVLDVRTPGEYAEGHVPGARLVPLNEVESGAAVPFEKSSTIYVICRSGKRSLKAASYLRSRDYSQAVSVDGGTMAWIQSGKPVEK